MFAGLVWRYALATFSEFADGVLGISPALRGEDPGGPPFESVQPLGILARPRDPTVGPDGQPVAGAGLLIATDGASGEGYAIPTTDGRAVAKIPQVAKGGTCLYASGPLSSFHHLDGDNGSQQIIVLYGEGGGKSLSITLSCDKAGKENIRIGHGDGHAVLLNHQGKVILHNAAGDAYVEVGPSGVTINGNLKVNGSIIGGNPVAAVPVALATETNALLAAINTALMSTGLAVVGPKANLAAPIVVPMPGSTVVNASPTP